MGVDISQINTETTVGQITLLIAIIVAGIVALRPVIKDLRKNKGQKKYAVMASEMESTKRELNFSIQIQRHNSEWQIVARELIRIMRLEMTDAGIPLDDRIQNLMRRLEEIEDRDIYSDHILVEEDE